MCAFFVKWTGYIFTPYNIDTSKHKLGMAALMIVWWHEQHINKY